LLGTLFIDRLMDTLVVGMLALCTALFNIKFFRDYYSQHPDFMSGIGGLLTSVWLYVALVVIAVCIWLVFARLGHISFIVKIKDMLLNVWEGIKSLWKMKHKTWFFLQTLMIWGCYFLYFYVTFFAFDFTRDLGPRIALIAFTMSSIAVAIPIQGGIGVWHFAVISTLVIFNVPESDASAFALIVYTIQSILCLVIVGIISIFALSIINRKE